MANSNVSEFWESLKRKLGFPGSIPGSLVVKIKIEAPRVINFRVDATRVGVNWDDGTETGMKPVTQYFSHTYSAPGIYSLKIFGVGLRDVEMPDCNAIELDFSDCYRTLEFINCNDNQLETLDFSRCFRLYEIYCNSNRLWELKLSKYDKLFYISCSSNDLTHLNLRGCRQLVNLRCSRNKLKEIDLRTCPKLVSVNIEENLFDMNGLTELVMMLKRRPMSDVGFVMLRQGPDYQYGCIRDYINPRGWFEM